MESWPSLFAALTVCSQRMRDSPPSLAANVLEANDHAIAKIMRFKMIVLVLLLLLDQKPFNIGAPLRQRRQDSTFDVRTEFTLNLNVENTGWVCTSVRFRLPDNLFL